MSPGPPFAAVSPQTARRGCLLAAVVALLLPAAAGAQRPQPADLVLRNGIVATLATPAQAQALAVRGGVIEAVGANAEMNRYIGPQTRVLDLHGAFVTPGFIEGHGHLMGTGQTQMELNLGQAPNWDAIVSMVQQAVAHARPGEWILGAGWQQSKWNPAPHPAVDGLPLPAALDAVSPNNPVMLEHASGHGMYVNAVALRLAGIDRHTPDPDGGSIVRDASGNAIGMLRDAAMAPVRAAYQRYLRSLPPAAVEARRLQALHLAVRNELSEGITTFVDMGENFATVDWLRQQAADGALGLRLYVNISGEPLAALQQRLPQYKLVDAGQGYFMIRGIGEILSDGALGTRTAWFVQPYSDAPRVFGAGVVPMSLIRPMAQLAARDGFQVSVHAIGDRANHETLDLFQQIFQADPAARQLRWRIEHAQHLLPSDIPRFAQLGVIASMQSIHACSDAPFVATRLGAERARTGAYVWRSLISSGAIVLDGTDTPVEDTNPIANFYCAVTRDEGNGTRFYPRQVKTPLEELRSYTYNNAYAIFEEKQLGAIAPGKVADLDVISGDLLTLPPSRILRTRVLYTIVGGRIVYTMPGAETWRGQLFAPMPEFDHLN